MIEIKVPEEEEMSREEAHSIRRRTVEIMGILDTVKHGHTCCN